MRAGAAGKGCWPSAPVVAGPGDCGASDDDDEREVTEPEGENSSILLLELRAAMNMPNSRSMKVPAGALSGRIQIQVHGEISARAGAPAGAPS